MARKENQEGPVLGEGWGCFCKILLTVSWLMDMPVLSRMMEAICRQPNVGFCLFKSMTSRRISLGILGLPWLGDLFLKSLKYYLLMRSR